MMLHILLFILKIIGIILAVILGIVILLISIVLFVPVRYELSGKCDGRLDTLKGKVTVTWLLHLIRLDAYYKNSRLKWRLRIAWIKRTGGQGKAPAAEVRGVKEEETDESKQKEASEVLESKEEISETCEESRKEHESCEETGAESMEEVSEEESGAHETAESTQKQGTNGEEGQRADTQRPDSAKESSGIGRKIKGIFGKIKQLFQSICDKIRELLEKKDRLSEFIGDEVHVGAFRKAKKEVFHLLKRLNPKKLTANIRYGFDDPCTTGQVLAGLSILYPFFGDHVNIIPDFENRILHGNLYVKGRVHGYYFLILCWNLIWCRHVRQTYKDIKNFEL